MEESISSLSLLHSCIYPSLSRGISPSLLPYLYFSLLSLACSFFFSRVLLSFLFLAHSFSLASVRTSPAAFLFVSSLSVASYLLSRFLRLCSLPSRSEPFLDEDLSPKVRHALHLHDGELPPQTDPRASMKNGVLEEVPVPVEPPLRTELETVLSPYLRHPSHGVRVVRQPRAFPHEAAVGKKIVFLSESRVKLHRRVKTPCGL